MLKSMLGGNAIWQLVTQADGVSKGVLFILLSLSIICWSVFFYKIILFRIKKQQLKKVCDALTKVISVEQFFALIETYQKTLPGYFLSKNMNYLKSIASFDSVSQKADVGELEWEMFQQHIDQTIEDIIYNEQSYLSILSTSAAVSPLLGLFGTVWGLVHSFVRISSKGNADIGTVAPGIAEALITTLAGLAVAVPSFVMFSYCSAQIRKIDHQFSLLADQFLHLTQRFVLKK